MRILNTFLQVIAAEFLALGTIYISHGICSKLFQRTKTLVIWTSAGIIAMWLLSVEFHLLILLHRFRLTWALALTGILVTVVRLCGVTFANFRLSFLSLIRALTRIWQSSVRGPHRFFGYLFLVFILLTLIRTLIVPPIAWDATTDHAVKAAMWVQSAGGQLMKSPGGWGEFRIQPGGGEVFTAWAMLPFHNDLLAGAIEVIQWLLLGLLLLQLAAYVHNTQKLAFISVAYILTIPVLQLSVGSLYVEIALYVALIASLYFAVRFIRKREPASLLLSLVAQGLAAGIKITALPLVALIFFYLLFILLAKPDRRFQLKWFLLGCIAALLVSLPWYLETMKETGYPLSPWPLSVAGVRLGVSNVLSDWYFTRPDLHPFTFKSEINALYEIFMRRLSPVTILSFLILPFALYKLIRTRKAEGILISAYCLIVIGYYFLPSFSVMRLLWGPYVSRFLFPSVAVAVTISFLPFGSNWRLREIYGWILITAAVFHMFRELSFSWSSKEAVVVPLLSAGVFCLLLIIRFASIKFRAQASFAFALTTITLFLTALSSYRSLNRYEFAAKTTVHHHMPKYWLAAAMIEEQGHPRRIAVTAGPWQDADNWFLYFFMGRNFQNTLVYVPITQDGSIVELIPGIERSGVEMEAWIQRLRKERITEVMTFLPRSLELTWMEHRPELFEKRAGNHDWGLFHVKQQAGRDHW